MSKRAGYLIHCPTEDDAKDLFEYLCSEGVTWAGGEALSSGNTRWENREDETCYYWEPSVGLRYGRKSYLEVAPEYKHIPIQTVDSFLPASDFEVASEDELIEMLTFRFE